MSRQVRNSALAVLALMATLTAACGQSSGNTSATKVAGGTVVQRLQGAWPTLNPGAQGSTDGYQVIGSFYDYLLALKGTKLVPYLATSWSVTPTSVKFTIRKDATCSDGTPVTATVVANSFKWLLLTVLPVYGALKSTFGQGPYTVTGDDATSTVNISIGNPYSGLIYAFSTQAPQSAIVCPKGIANPSSLATTPQGSGPFTFSSMVAGDSITLSARPDWHWGPDGISSKSSGFPQTLTYRVVTNDTTAANLLTTGGLAIAQILGPDNTRLRTDTSLVHHTSHSYLSTDIIFNQAAGHPTTDLAVRQALSYALDPKAFGLATYNGLATTATSVLAEDAECYDPTTKSLVPTQSVAKSKQIMSAAGYKMGSDGSWQDKNKPQPLTIVIAGGTSQNNGPDYLSDAISAAGFSVKLNKTDRAAYAAAYLGGNFDVAISIPTSPTPDPNGNGSIGLYVGQSLPNGNNATRLDYPDIDAELAAANAATGSESCKHWANVQHLLLKSNIIMPMVTPQYQWYGRGVEFVVAPTVVNAVFLRRVR